MHLVALVLGDGPPDVVDQHPMGEAGRQEVARRLVVPLPRDDLYCATCRVSGLDELLDDVSASVTVNARSGTLHAALTSGALAPRPRPGRSVPTMLARNTKVAARSAARGLASPHMSDVRSRSCRRAVPAGLVVVDDLDLGKAAVVRDRAVVLDEAGAEQGLPDG